MAKNAEIKKDSLIINKFTLISLVVILQFSILGYHVWQSEQVLSKGTLIKLELQPIDPRSLLQGDYVVLNYTISQPKVRFEDYYTGQKVYVLLEENDEGVYEFSKVFSAKENTERHISPNEVVLNG